MPASATAAAEEAFCILKPMILGGAATSKVDDRESASVKLANVGKARSKGKVACAAYTSSWDLVGAQGMPFGIVTALMTDKASSAAALASAMEIL